MKNKLALVLIVLSALLIIVNFISTEEMDSGFWMRIGSSVLIIIAMILVIRAGKLKDKKEN
jgi:uncharacterized membrane protein